MRIIIVLFALLAVVEARPKKRRSKSLRVTKRSNIEVSLNYGGGTATFTELHTAENEEPETNIGLNGADISIGRIFRLARRSKWTTTTSLIYGYYVLDGNITNDAISGFNSYEVGISQRLAYNMKMGRKLLLRPYVDLKGYIGVMSIAFQSGELQERSLDYNRWAIGTGVQAKISKRFAPFIGVEYGKGTLTGDSTGATIGESESEFTHMKLQVGISFFF